MPHGGRDLGLDAARGVALLSMFVAHFAPTDGPGKILTLSEYLTAFLFVLLIGAGAELAKDSTGRWRSTQARAAVLILLGILLAQPSTQIVVVLVWLGIMSVLATWLVLLPWWGLSVIATASTLFTGDLLDWATGWLPLHLADAADPLTQGAVTIPFGDPYYRLSGFLLPACAGILFIRYARSEQARTLVAGVSALLCLVLFGLDAAGTIALDPYSGTRQEVLSDTALALLALSLCSVLAPRLRPVAVLLASAGAMALTLYVAQILGDWAYFKIGGVTDDRWVILVGACLGALAFAALWRPVATRTGWRGPLEGPVDALARGRWPARSATVARIAS